MELKSQNKKHTKKDSEIKIVTNFGTLMRLASELGQAKKSGNQKRIEEAQKEHDNYCSLCRKSDEMSLNMTNGQIQIVMHGK